MSGNQLLRVLVGILNDDLLCKVGNAILLSIGGSYYAAILIFEVTWIEFQFAFPIDSNQPHKVKVFRKLFDNQFVSMCRNDQKYEKYCEQYTETVIQGLRIGVKSTFPYFLSELLSNSETTLETTILCSFLLILLKIAQTEITRGAYRQIRTKLHAIPVASCVMLVMCSEQTENMGLLRQLFGEGSVDDNEDIDCSYSDQKAEHANTAAAQILRAEISHSGVKFEEKEIQKVVDKIKELYEL